MKFKFYSLLLTVFLSISFVSTAFASHAMGADLTYNCVGGNTYQFRLAFYRDCAGITPSSSITLNISSASCGISGLTLTINQQSVQEVSPICPAQLAQSTCNGGTLPGVQQYVYTGTYTMPANCTDWVISFSECCRNSAITNLTTPDSYNLYVEANMNNLSATCNNSPDFTTLPVPYICAGQPFTYNHGAYDAEGDSLVYDLIAPRTDGVTTLTPAGGTSPTQPFATSPANGLSFNPSNGTMTFTPSGLQNSVVVVRVREYRNGVLISTVMRDMQVVVISCSNNAPTLTSPVATTGGTYTNSATGGTFRVCAGNTLTFQVTGNDANLTDILSMTSNFPGATIVQVGNNPAVFTVTVPTSTATIGQYNFTLRIQDNACPIFGSFTIAYDLYIQGIDNISVPSNPVCTSTAQSFPMTAFVPGGLPAGATITWSPSTFLSSTSGSTVTVNLPANAALPITYTATYSNGVCTNQQTLTLNGGTLTLSVTPATATVCTGSTVTLNANATASGGAAITYAWAPSATLSASNISNPVATPTASTVYVVTATANGCTATASSNVTLGTATTAASNTGPYCGGATIQLNATGGTSYSWSGPGGFTSTSASPTLTGATSAMAGTYTATITTASGCTATQATNVTVNQYSVSVTPAAPFVCGTAAALTATLYNNGTAVASSGYNVNPITFTNTTTAGTSLTLGDDAISGAIPIGFTFNFFGNNYTQLYIGSNGFITFNGASGSGCCSGGVIPTAGNGVDDFIALAWNDLYPPGAGTITYSVQGTAPNRIFVVSYTGIPHCCGSTAAITGQILLYESTNNIEIYSGSIVNDGSTMTQGIENAAGTQGFFVPGRNSADWSATSSAYQFAPVQPATYAWGPATGLSATNISNPTANPASTTTYTVTATAGGCTTTATVTVTVGALPPPTASGTTICPNSTATLTATASNTIEWYTAATGGTLLATGASYTTPALTTTTTYYVQQVSGACVSTRTAVVVTVADVTPPTIVNCPANITLTASGAGCTAPASWTAPTATDNCPAGCITNPLSTILTNFTANSATIAATVPSRFTFAMDATNGVNGTNISDGGSDMYDGGNFINTNLATSISYSNNTIINSNSFGTGGQYFTSYQNGIFMLAANVNNLSTFGISGNNGADGGGTTDGATFSITINCQTYNVFLRRVYNATDPSINQMIIIPANASASQTFPNDTNDGTQTLSGISATTRIYYLLYAGTSGSFINNATAQTIATTFITQLGATTSTSITVAQTQGPASGSNFPVGTTNIQYTATDVAGNSSTCNFTVTVNSTVTASVTPANAALTCATPSTTLTASGGGTYLWNATGGNATTAAITASAAGTYVVTVTGTNGCTATAQSVVTSSTTVPTASVTPASATLTCTATSTTLTASGGATYLWNAAGGNATTAAITASAAGTYVVTITAANGCTATAQSVITSNTTPPAASVTPASATLTCTTTSTGLTASGGGTYLWNATGGNATTAAITASAAGTYVVTVTSATNGCTATAQSVITSNTTPPTATVTPASATLTCTTTSTGLTASGGGTYLWNATGGNATTAAITASAAGTYVVTVTNTANGCTATAQSVISSNTTPPTASVTPASATLTCTTTSTGLTASGGGTYLWNATGGNATTAAITASAAGTYVVTVTSATNGCTATAQSVISSNTTPPTASVTPASATLTCTTTSTGLTASGGGTYLWNATGGNATTAAITASAAGTYVVTVTSATNGCTATAQSVITSNTTPPTASVTPASATLTCTTTSTGLTASGGGTYLWNATGGNATTAAITASAAGTYVVTVTSATNGCTATAQSVITSNTTPPTASVTPVSATLTCTTTSTALTASGGGTYLWNATGGNATTAAITASAAGTYVVTVTSATNGCTATAQSVITSNTTPPTATVTPASATLTCTTTSTGLTASGGGTYLWNATGGNATTAAITASAAGTYVVTVTSATNGCTATAQSVITSNTTPPTATVTPASATLTCTTTSTSLTASGGGTYLWNATGGNATTAAITASAAGTYVVTVTNTANGCTATAQSVITSNTTPPTASVTPVSATLTCTTTSTSLTASGGGTYLWNATGGNATTAAITASAAGTYVVTVTSATNGCTATAQSIITSNTTPPTASISPASPCVSPSATLTASGGGTYLWNAAGGNATTAAITASAAGTYAVTVTSATNGCTATASVVASSTVVVSNITTTCAISGATYTVSFNISGGDGTYLVNGGAIAGSSYTSANINSGTAYNFSVSDGNACPAVAVTGTNTCTAPTTCAAPAGCYGPSQIVDGSFEAFNAATPFANFTSSYDYSTCPGSICFNGATPILCQYDFSVQTNPNGCNNTWSSSIHDHTTGTGNMMIVDFPAGNVAPNNVIWSQTVTLLPNTAYCFGAYFINLLPTGSNQPLPVFTFTANGVQLAVSPSLPENEQWNFYGAQFNSGAGGAITLAIRNQNFGNVGYDLAIDDITVRELIAGTPPTMVADAATFCNSVASTTINVLSNDSNVNTAIPVSIATAPPFTDGVATVNANNTITFTPAAGFTGTTSFDYRATSLSGCTAQTTVTVTVNATPTVSVTPASATLTCTTTSTSLTASGGASYLWNATGGNATTATITASAAGTYVVTATAANTCTATAQTVITSNTTPPTASVTPASATLTCATTSTGLTASGGGTYLWNAAGGNATTAAITASAAGTYVVTVTNTTNGCTATAQSVITSNTTPPTASVTPASATLTCTTTSTGLTASGGGTYLWNATGGNATTAAITASAAGTYVVTVTSATNGCTATAQSVITSNTTPPTASVTPASATLTCTTTSTGLTASGGGTYLWNTTGGNATTAAITASAAGTYVVTVTSGTNGCTATAQSVITSNTTVPTASVTPTSAILTCATTSTGLTASGGGTYLWNATGGNATTAAITASAAGTYVVTVTNTANGCTATAQSVVTSNVTPPSVAIAPSISTLTCASTSSTLTASGAVSYVWSTGATTASINVALPNTYTVTGTAANGCTATASTTINQNITAPTASVTPNSATVDCNNPTVTLTASGGVSYLWGTGATTASINANAAGSYPVTVTAANGCTAIATANVNANQTAPTASISPAGPTITIANGSTTVLTATGGTGYVWSTGATTNAITVSTSGTYTVTVTDGANGCTAVATRIVVVLPPEVCTNGVDDDGDGFVDCADPDCSNCNTVCGPSQNYLPSYFSSGSNGYNQPLAIGASDLHWTSSLVFGGTQTPAVVVGQCVGAWINSPFPGSQWIGHAAYGCGNTYPGQGTVYFSYNFNLPANQVPSYAISLDLYADNLITGIWVNGTLVNPGGFGGFTAGSQTTVNLSGFVAGSNTITIALLETAPAGQSTPGGLLVQASVSGDADGDGVSDANDNCPNTPSGTAVDAQGCPAATASSTNAYCPGNSGTVTALPANATAYSWSGPNGFTANTQTATVNNINGNTTFTVTATLSNGCTSSASTVVGNTGPLPEVCTNGIDDDCDGLIDALDPDCCGGWEIRGTATAINNVFPYYYHLTDATTGQGGGVWSNSRFDFSQSFSVTYQAYFGNIDGNGADGMAFVIHNDPLGYNAPIVQGGGLGVGMTPCFTTEFDTYDNGAGAGDIAADHTAIYANNQANTIPGGTAVQASATNGNIEDGQWHNVSITWNATTQTFTVNFDGVQRLQTVYNFVQNVFSNNPILYFGFTASTGGSVNVQEVRNIVVNGTRIEVCGDGIDNDCDNLVDCADTDCQFTASASAPNSPCGNASIPLSVTTSPVIANHNVLTPTYSWTGVGGFTSTAASPTVTSVNSNADGAYNVTVTANGGCTAAATTNVVTLPAPVPVVTNDGPHCPGTNLVLTATNGVSYTWSGPNGFTATGATATVTGTTPASSGVYSVTVTAANGCTGTGSTSATINTTPSVSAGADQTLCGNATAIIATVPSGGLAPYTYTWDNGLGAGQQQTVGPNQTTTYTVTATDANGCTGSDNMILNVVPITLSPNTQICLGTCTTLTATGGAGLLGVTWSPTTGLSASQGLTVTACPTATTTYTATYATPGASFITNGTFTGSTGGFTSSYIYSPTNLVPEGTYAVITNPQSAHTGFSACPDHTGGGSAMMVVNGSGTANTVVWTQTVPVTPNTDYQFSTWVQSVAAGSPAQLQFSINGVTIGSVFNSPAATCTWQQFFQIWNSGASTTATISIINQNTSTGGNDFALDDIAFSPVCLRTRQVTVTVNSVTPTISSNTPICAGTDLNLTASGGTDYNWSGANTFTSTVQNPTITAATTAATGNYNVTITDAATGCTATATTSVVVNPLPVVTVTGGGSYCEGSAIQLTATGGGTYAWSGPNGFTSNIANPNIPVSSLANDGVYTVTVTTAAGCTATASLTLVINTLPTPTAANNTPICAGLDLNLTGTGGGTYAWAGPNGFASALQNPTITAATAAASGTYSLTVTNAAGCTALATTLATVNANPTTTASSNSPICEGFTLNLSATGLLSYAWSGPNGFTANTVSPSLANATPAASGVYIVTITDGNSCTATSSVNVTVNTTPTVTATNNTPVCTGASIQLTATGGTTYAWSGPSGYTANVSNPIIASSQMTNNGTYSVTVTDANGCSAVTTTNVVVHETPTLAMNTVTPPTCFGLSNGSINIDEALGQAPFTYTWSNPTFGNVEDPTNIVGAGTYSVTVTTADGCTATMSNIVVTEPAVLALTLNSTSNVLCNAECNGTITITASGGTAAYNYTWSDPAFPNTANPTTVCAGTYSVTVTDQQACTATLSNIVITEPAVLTATADTTNVSCFNACNGAIDVTATGGTLPYTYAWSGTLGNVEDPTNVCAGVYSVTITDANACTFVINNITIQEPSDLTVTVQNIVDAQCFNACDGTINMDVVGGSAPYTFQWNNPAFGNTQSPTSIVCAGTYSVTVTDSHGCFVVINNIVVGQPALLTSTLIGTTALTCNPVNANGTTNGAIDIDVQGGTATYNYEWSNLAFGNVQDPTGVAAGTYSVTVTDLQSCTVVLANIVVTEPAPISATFVVVNDQCNPANNPVRTGSADMTVTGGTGPYTYVWSNGALTEDIQNLGTGAYDVTITDQNGCTSTASVFITEPTPIILTTTHTDATCFGASNGGIDLSATGGTQGATGYTYLWTNGAVTQDLSNIPAGNYCVTTTDANGCTASACVTISQPTQLVVTIGNVLQATCNGTCNGRATAQATGGTSAINVYTYEWNDGQATPTATGLCAGIHTVTVTDDNGCTATASVTITEPTSLDLNIATTNVSCFANANDGTATATATGGVAPYSFEWSNNLVGQSVTGLQTGNYDVTVTDANSCTYSEPFFIASPNPFIITPSTTNATCFGLSDGTISVNPFGGTAPYTYLWSDAQLTAMAVGIPANTTYSVTVTDAQGCTSTAANLSVSEPTQLTSVTTVETTVTCNGEVDGSASVAVAGGTPAYTYLWDNFETSNMAIALAAGTHRVTITDNNGCTTVNTVAMSEPAVLQAEVSHTNVVCYNEANGAILIDTVFGGTAPYEVSLDSITWATNISAGYVFEGLTAGVYDIWLRDANGCMLYFTQSISQPTDIGVNVDGITIQLGENGELNPVVLNVPIGAIYTWSPADSTISCLHCMNPTVDPVETTVYTLTVQGANGCSDSDTAIVVVDKERRVYIPTAFTPNSDDNNDTFTIYGGSGVLRVKRMLIFDRWGELIYEQSNFPPADPSYGWDGTYKGKPVNPTAFVYYIEVEFADGQVLPYKGDVSVIK